MRYSKRKPMKQWIKEKLDSKSYPGLRWLDKNRGKFEISWKHGSLETWSWKEDVHVFREWAIYTGKYQPSNNKTVTQEDMELAKTWKTNFRCALNALPGVEIVKEESSARGANARKVYIMKVDKKKKKRRCEDQKSLDLETKPLTPISEGIDQEAIDELEQLPPSSTVFKKDFAEISDIQDIFQYDDLFAK